MGKNFKEQVSPRMTADYGTYVFSAGEQMVYLAQGLLLTGSFAYFFYRSVWAFLCLTPFLIFFDERSAGCLRRNGGRS